MQYKYTDGTTVPQDRMVFIDNVMGTFTVKLRSMRKVDVERLKRLIESQFEVTAITEVEQVAICKLPLQETDIRRTLVPAA